MPIKRPDAAAGNAAAQQSPPNGDDHTEFELRENPRINAQIDAYKKQFPKKWAFIKSMPRERLERALVLAKIRSQDQRQKLNQGLLRKVENDEAFNKDCEAVLKHFPESEREHARVNMARNYVLSQSRQQRRGVAVAN
ncbi:MAG TPA: hypothetical protein VGY56_08540 [Verrucomicrobiae bacterium]|nr:hypothetical protein [Verrucomicrobiae bacterium]